MPERLTPQEPLNPAEIRYEIAMPLHAFFLHEYRENQQEFAYFLSMLNDVTEDKYHQTVALDSILYYNPDEENSISKYPLTEEQAIVGQFLGFRHTQDEEGKSGIAVCMLVNVAPGSSPGITREEEIPLWNEEAAALRWPNFNSRPRPKPNFWHHILRLG